MMRALMIAAVLALALAGCGDDAPKRFTIDLKGPLEPAEQARASAGLNAFMQACQPLFRDFWGDVVEAKAQFWPVYDYTAEAHGWSGEMLWIEVRITDQPKAIPKRFYAQGHTLHYYAGTGDRPGLIAKKDQSAEVCGMIPSRKGNDVFKPDAGFAVLAR